MNTLSFATSAKEVTNKAQVNRVVSDKNLGKHVQKEVARLEAELQKPYHSSSCFRSLSIEKELKIEQVVSDKNLGKHLQKEVARLEAELQKPDHSSSCFRSLLIEKELKIEQLEKEKKVLKRQRNKLLGMIKNVVEECNNVRDYATEAKEMVAKLQYQKQLLISQVVELEAKSGATGETDTLDEAPMPWHLMFEEQRKQIIMLWHLCHVSIIHRSQFYLLIRGDPTDQIYVEVELRRLKWLEQHFAELGNANPTLLGDQPAGPVASSIKALKQEREYLATKVSSKLTTKERELVYMRWNIPPIGKQRRLQLVNKLWTDPLNIQNMKESAELVAKLVGFCESCEHASKEMFGLNFGNPSDKKT